MRTNNPRLCPVFNLFSTDDYKHTCDWTNNQTSLYNLKFTRTEGMETNHKSTDLANQSVWVLLLLVR